MQRILPLIFAGALVCCHGCCGDSSATTEPAPTAEMRAVGAGELAFAWELLAQLRSSRGNLVVSPLSIHAVLGMTSAGAAGRTVQELIAVLHAPRDGQLFQAGMAGLRRRYQAARAYELVVANRLFACSGTDFNAPFLAVCRDDYQELPEQVAFPDPGRDAINAWVGEATRKRITELIPLGGVSAQTQLVLANALYFKGRWAEPFPRELSKDGRFSLDAQAAVTVSFMLRTSSFAVAHLAGATMVELPYAGRTLAMDVILPQAVDGLAAVEGALDAAAWRAATASLQATDVELLLPRFALHPPPTELKAPLVAMGLQQAFTAGDFSRMSARALVISEVWQQAAIDVDEEGTVAAAATSSTISAASEPSAPPLVVQVDHPFLVIIRDLATGAIIVMGRVVDPR
jgi:serpin B